MTYPDTLPVRVLLDPCGDTVTGFLTSGTQPQVEQPCPACGRDWTAATTVGPVVDQR